MPDSTTPPVAPAETETPRPRGYFNRAQLEDITLSESVQAAAHANPAAMADRDIDAAFLLKFQEAIDEAHSRSAATASQAADAQEATLESNQTAAALRAALQAIQSAAKQKYKMLAIDGDSTTNFPTDGYLIGGRLNGSRANLLQSAVTLIARARQDNLPGYKTPESIAAVEALLAQYRDDKDTQQETTRSKETARLDRDDLIELVNARRAAVQHAADAIWPWSLEANRPTRKTFSLPLTRPLGM